jgi:hypothetical protein
VFAIIAAARGDERNAPALSPADEIAMPITAAADSVAPPGLPTIGKWMLSADGAIAHWLGEIYEGKRLREPINVILVDAAAASVDDAKQRLVEAAAAAGYPIRFGHSTGYRAHIGGQIYAQLPAGRDDAFSNRIFELSNNHGRIFGPSSVDGAYVFIGAFSREEVRPFRSPEHGYASFCAPKERGWRGRAKSWRYHAVHRTAPTRSRSSTFATARAKAISCVTTIMVMPSRASPIITSNTS